MSYDLHFYKLRTTDLSETTIANYLTDNLVPENEAGGRWFFANLDTDVYYYFTHKESDSDEPYKSFSDFDNTQFSFKLNFARPSFFGLEAFQFVEKLMSDLTLFVLNPQ